MWRRALALTAALVLSGTPGFTTPFTPIGDLIRNPDAYANATVSITGTVTSQAIGYLADTAYTIQGSDDYRITVFGRGVTPAPGTRLAVTGKVGRRPPDEEFDFPPVVVETSRQVQP
jgi:hypothetical protein